MWRSVTESLPPPAAEPTSPKRASQEIPVPAVDAAPSYSKPPDPNESLIQDLQTQLASKDALIISLQEQLSTLTTAQVFSPISTSNYRKNTNVKYLYILRHYHQKTKKLHL